MKQRKEEPTLPTSESAVANRRPTKEEPRRRRPKRQSTYPRLTTMSEDKQGVSLPHFSGDKDEFMGWWYRMEQYAQLKNFDSALQATDETDLPAAFNTPLDPTKPDEKKQIDARKRNNMAVSNILMALPMAEMVSARKAAYKDKANWPKGKASLLVAHLEETYHASSALASVSAANDIAKVSMKKGEDPAVLFKQFDAIEVKYEGVTSANISEELFVARIIAAVPSMYRSTVTPTSIVFLPVFCPVFPGYPG